MRFVLTGKFTPYVRMTQRSKFVDPQAQKYLASKDAMGWQLRQQMTIHEWDMLPPKTPLSVSIRIQMTGGLHKQDCDNQVKGLMDFMQGIVYLDDRWIDEIYVTRWISAYDRVSINVLEITKVRSCPSCDRSMEDENYD